MRGPNQFPFWIVEAINKNQDQLHPKSKEYFDKVIELFPHFDQSFLNIPTTSDVGVLKSYDLGEVKIYYGLESPQEFILLNICELFHFQATYQLREIGLSLLSSLSEGRFYVSAILSRAMFEVVCVNYYTFRRVERQFNQCLEYLRTAAKTSSPAERTKILEKYYQGTYEIFSRLFDANAATSINWQQYLLNKFNVTIEAGKEVKKVHVNTAIKDLEEQSGLPLFSAYNILSEFVHPNAGSKMLVVNTKLAHDPLMDALRIGDNKANAEAALFYIDHVSESMFYTWTLALTLFDRGQKLISDLDGLVPGKTSKNVH